MMTTYDTEPNHACLLMIIVQTRVFPLCMANDTTCMYIAY